MIVTTSEINKKSNKNINGNNKNNNNNNNKQQQLIIITEEGSPEIFITGPKVVFELLVYLLV